MEIPYYRLFNNDLNKLTNDQLIIHYKINKNKEKRLVSRNDFYNKYTYFDLNFYKLHIDLAHYSEYELIKHYLEWGINEKRLSSQKMFFEKYSNFNLNFYKFIYDDIAIFEDNNILIQYWLFGNKENRIISEQHFLELYPNFNFDNYKIYFNLFDQTNMNLIKHFLNYDNELKKIILQINTVTTNKDLNKLENLIIIACHTNNDFKYNTLINNINFLNENTNYPIIIINSIGTERYNYNLKNVMKVFFINNDKYFDFGKWSYVIDFFTHITKYKNIIFTNDSFIMTHNIDNFYGQIESYDLFGYNDSSQMQYHYQSFLFAVKSNKINIFNGFIKKHKNNINNYDDLVKNYEFGLNSLFINSNCYLKLAYVEGNEGQNIGFMNDKLYEKLIKTNLLPFIKIKKLYWEKTVPNFITEYLIKLNLLRYM